MIGYIVCAMGFYFWMRVSAVPFEEEVASPPRLLQVVEGGLTESEVQKAA